MWRVLSLIALLGLVGCGNNPPVPVVEANRPVMVEGGGAAATSPTGVPRDGYYIIKKGDNLYRIGLAYGVTAHDLLTWNNLTDETKISVGQEIRVVPPEGQVVEVQPIAGPAPIIVVGDDASPTSTTAPTPVGAITEPRGGKIAYSDTALAQVKAMEGGSAARISATPTPSVAPPPTVPVTAPTQASVTKDGVEWTWPLAGKVIAGFVEGGNGKESNRGVDLAGRKGESIQAAAAGKVTFVGTLRGYGDFLVVRHNADYISVYAHTSKILVKRDQSVDKGQKIAEVGSSDADQPKLHFEIRYKSEPVDPLKLLPVRQ